MLDQVRDAWVERRRKHRKGQWQPAHVTYALGPVRRRRFLACSALLLLVAQLMWNWIPDAAHMAPEVFRGLIPMLRADWGRLDDSVKATIEGQFRLAIVQGLVALGAGIALMYTARTYRMSYRAQVTDRFFKALERLGSEEIYIRIGAVQALEQILHDSPGQVEPSVKVLTAFVRHRSAFPNEECEPVPANCETPSDVQTALTTMTRINIRSSWPIDLSCLWLPGAQFHRADLADADLRECDLTGAEFYSARLIRANLSGAQCERAKFDRADLERAVLGEADLSQTWFRNADLTRAFMAEAYLNWSHFENSTLVGTFLHDAIARRVLFDGADLRYARLAGADLSGSWFRGAVLAGADLEGANIDGSDLYSAEGLTVEQIVAALPTSATHLPWAMKKDPRVVQRIKEVEAGVPLER